MKNLLKLEELLMFAFALFLFSGLDYGWGWYALLFLTPDLSMLGYLANPRSKRRGANFWRRPVTPPITIA